MTGELTRLRDALNTLKGERKQINYEMKEASRTAQKCQRSLGYAEEAQIIIQAVAQQTQMELEYHLSEIVTLALATVFEEPYELKVKFVMRAGRTEVDILFTRDGEEIDPLMAAGGGPVDVATFALRIALWSMSRPKSRATIVLDEPFRFLSREYQPRASTMLRLLSEKLGLQIIMISHSEDLIEGAAKIFQVGLRKGISRVMEGVDRSEENGNGNDKASRKPAIRRRPRIKRTTPRISRTR